MSRSDGITDDVRKREEEYFRARDRELIERMREAAMAAEARRTLENATGIHDAPLLQDLQELGFTPDTLPLLPLVPVVQVAWAEGGVSAAERTLIQNIARARGIEDGSPAAHQLLQWLDQRPSDDTFHKAGRLIEAMLDQPAGAAAVNVEGLLDYCQQIAAASGGIFGIGKVSAEERAAIEEIAQHLRKR